MDMSTLRNASITFGRAKRNYQRVSPREINLVHGVLYTVLHRLADGLSLLLKLEYGESGWAPRRDVSLIRPQHMFATQRYRATCDGELSVGLADQVWKISESLDSKWCHVYSEKRGRFGFLPSNVLGTRTECVSTIARKTNVTLMPSSSRLSQGISSELSYARSSSFQRKITPPDQIMDLSNVSERDQQRARINLIDALVRISNLSRDSCAIIVGYLQFQAHWTEFNAILHNGGGIWFIRFVMLLLHNATHYVISIALWNITTSVPFAVLSVAETAALRYFYTAYNGVRPTGVSNEELFARINNRSNVVIQIAIFLPMTGLLFVFTPATSVGQALQAIYAFDIVSTVQFQSYVWFNESWTDEFTNLHPSVTVML